MPDDLQIAALVQDAGDNDWLDYPDIPGFRVKLAGPDNPATVRVATRAAMLKPVAVPDDQEALADQNAEYHFLKVREWIAGWEGLKAADLPRLFPGKKLNLGETPEDAELAYNPGNLDFLLVNSRPFYTWVNAQVNAREVQEEAERKNS